ncbi:MAG: sigma-70 family RNA polymerase sigma factor [Phycisphaerales bacterium]|nr:MAG: sigma-70 family RNA polymerase sigma factor [Phycisphaerales bacterium]
MKSTPPTPPPKAGADAHSPDDAPPERPQTHAAWVTAAVERFEGPLTSYATRMLGGDVERARDVVQDAFLKLCQEDRAKVNGHLAQWLYTVCRNRALDVGRKEQRMTPLGDRQLESADERPQQPPEESGGPLLALLASLPPRQQEAVRLKFQGGLSYREISTVMETTANNVGVLIHTALKTIREKLGEVRP